MKENTQTSWEERPVWTYVLGGCIVLALVLFAWVIADASLVVGQVTRVMPSAPGSGQTLHVQSLRGPIEVASAPEEDARALQGRWIVGDAPSGVLSRRYILPVPFPFPFAGEVPSWAQAVFLALMRWKALCTVLGVLLLITNPYWLKALGGAAIWGLGMSMLFFHVAALASLRGALAPLDSVSIWAIFLLGEAVGFIIGGRPGPPAEVGRRIGVLVVLLAFQGPAAAFLQVRPEWVTAFASLAAVFSPLAGVGLVCGLLIAPGLGAGPMARYIVVVGAILVAVLCGSTTGERAAWWRAARRRVTSRGEVPLGSIVR